MTTKEKHPASLNPDHNPEAEFTSASFYAYLSERRLMGSRCTTCAALHLPPRPLCMSCFGDEMIWTELSGEGKLVAFTTVHVAPTAMIEAGYGRDEPYCTGIVRLAEGPSISAQILGVDAAQPERITIGAPVRIDFVERGAGDAQRTFLAFRPI